ncbi:ABC transporter permease [Nocardioides jejuensis]|uniref:ABC transporter permease n=1 Tax=Nocardioides jejuensis TaxID=2502782 RepID=A0A4R1CFV9_9ACTN|nr:ABC transporter permease [Nocardioides jejuensis]TCJ30009.1 ABC transporter permease [Nocardioides jejuensis]
MSAVIDTPAPSHAADDGRDRRPSFARLVGVELRKMADTKAGLWLLIVVAVVTVLVNAGVLIFGHRDDLGFTDLLQMSGIPQGFLLPVLAILLITQEWGQRTGLATFTLTPHRGRVVAAKLAAALGFVLGAFVIAVAIALVLTPLTGHGFDGVTANWLGRLFLGVVIGALQGFAFGALLLSTAFAIVTYFAAPMVLSIVASIWTSAGDKLAWVDFGSAQGVLFDPSSPSGTEWGHIVTTSLLWVALPLVIGIWRIRRSEVK